MESVQSIQDTTSNILDQIPILHVRGTNYEVGYTIGRQFRSLIEEITSTWSFLIDVLHPAYESQTGKQIYDRTLDLCEQKFPNYVSELRGMAEGSKVPFYKLFLMHLESVMIPPKQVEKFLGPKEKGGIGCTSVMADNAGEIILGHTEDTSIEFANNVYIVSSEILDDKGDILEKFSTLTYPGHLPGYTMGFNVHGMIYSINTLYPTRTSPGRIPRTFLTRAILACKDMSEVLTILSDPETGSSDGFSLNIAFVNDNDKSFVGHNVEVAPTDGPETASLLSIFKLPANESFAHCNRYMRLEVSQLGDPEFNSSCHRLKAFEKYERPIGMETMKKILSDRSDPKFPIYRIAKPPDSSVTVAVGIFDRANRKWSIFTKPPSESSPVAVISIEFY